MIDYINTRLVSWAAWAIKRADNGGGYPRQSHYTKLVHSHCIGNIDEINEAAMEIERGVLELRAARADLYAATMEFYRKTGSVEYKARMLGICRDTLYSRVHGAHVWLMNWMQDQEVERWEKQRRANKFRLAA